MRELAYDVDKVLDYIDLLEDHFTVEKDDLKIVSCNWYHKDKNIELYDRGLYVKRLAFNK